MPFLSKKREKPDFLFENWDIAEPDLMLGRILRHHLKAETLSNGKHYPELFYSYFALRDMHFNIQYWDSNPHICKNTNILTLKICVEYVLVINKHLIHNIYSNSMAKKWADSRQFLESFFKFLQIIIKSSTCLNYFAIKWKKTLVFYWKFKPFGFFEFF